jgi:signal transduction histidine kinase
VTIRLGRLGRHAELRVSDTGCGIAPELLSRVFEPFWQGEAGADRDGAGLGLGLAIVRRLVELHGGTIAAQSGGAGKGTLVRVTIPLIERGEQARDDMLAERGSCPANGRERNVARG